MIEALQFEFMRHALFAGLLVSVATGVIGAYVVTNRMVFVSGGVAHAAYGGVGLGYYFGFNPVYGAVAFAVAASLGMGAIQRRARQRADTIIGALWAIGMAVGIILIDLTPGYKADLMSYLFGSILTVSRTDLWVMASLDAAVLLLAVIFHRPLVAYSFDEDFARVRNLPVAAMHLGLLALIALAVVLMMRVVGLILVIAMLTLPVAAAGQLVRGMRGLMLLGTLFGALFSTVGLWLSFRYDLTSGAAIILVAGSTYLLLSLYRAFRPG